METTIGLLNVILQYLLPIIVIALIGWVIVLVGQFMSLKNNNERLDMVYNLLRPVIIAVARQYGITDAETFIVKVDILKDRSLHYLEINPTIKRLGIDINTLNYLVEEAIEDYVEEKWGIVVELNDDNVVEVTYPTEAMG